MKTVEKVAFLFFALFLAAPSVTAFQNAPVFSWTQLTSEPTTGLDWSPDGDSIAALSDDWDEAILLNWQSGEITQRTALPYLEYAPSDYVIRWSPDGQSIVIPKGNVYILNSETGNLRTLREAREDSGYFNADWGADSQLVAALNTDGFLDLISLQTGEIDQTIDISTNHGWRGSLLYYYFDWSPDSNLIAAPNRIALEPPVVAFWDQEGNILDAYTLEYPEDQIPDTPCFANATFFQHLGNVEWANDSRTLAVSGGDGVGICRLNIGGTIHQQLIPNSFGGEFDWSPDQRWLVWRILNDNQCALWFASISQNYQTFQVQIDSHPCYVYGLAWSPDSQHLAASTDSGIWIGTLQSSAGG